MSKKQKNWQKKRIEEGLETIHKSHWKFYLWLCKICILGRQKKREEKVEQETEFGCKIVKELETLTVFGMSQFLLSLDWH